MCFSINIWNLLTLSAVLMGSGKLFHNLAPWYVREFRPWVVVTFWLYDDFTSP